MKVTQRVLLAFAIIAIIGCKTAILPPLSPGRDLSKRELVDYRLVQPLVNSRCVVCHSCLESPCQLNMQSWEGFKRGVHHHNVYDGERIDAVEPTRMFEDALSENAWRQKGFVDILAGGDDSLLISTLRLSKIRTKPPTVAPRDSLICPQNRKQIRTSGAQVSELAMPYGFPTLSLGEQELLSDWVANGAPGPSNLPLSADGLPEPLTVQVKAWQSFLNAKDLNSRVVSRYLYEHLYLAHLFVKEAPRSFLKLTRSSTPCELGVTPIATRRPIDDPGIQNWYYCFYRDPAVVVYKTHLPYELSTAKLKWIKNNFTSPKWRATRFPSFASEVAGNPFLAFSEIPTIARHRFLLADAEYEVMTFIKGPVCNGSFAVNSIQDQFFIFFSTPENDIMHVDQHYAAKTAKDQILPGSLGTDLSLAKIFSGYYNILMNRIDNRKQKSIALAKQFPAGLGLTEIWDGGGVNDNAVLTVFRHDDNAKVVKGAKGDLAKTILLLDYATFERMVYNLAINFDVFDNITHNLLTRLYMDILRMDAEENFLQFLPAKARIAVKDSWYKGWLTKWKLGLLEDENFANVPSKVEYADDQDPKTQLVRKILFGRLNQAVRGEDDRLNWKALKSVKPANDIETQLRELTSMSLRNGGSRFPVFFPELSLLVIRDSGTSLKVYSIIRNREHLNISWILNEEGRLQPEEDTLTILPGILGAYPNRFFAVTRQDLDKMVKEITSIRDVEQYRNFLAHYGVDRMDPRIWNISDELHRELEILQPVEAGVLDLSRYSIESKQ